MVQEYKLHMLIVLVQLVVLVMQVIYLLYMQVVNKLILKYILIMVLG